MCQHKSKTILILTAQFGAGHISAANSIKDCILNEHKNWNIIIKNFININTFPEKCVIIINNELERMAKARNVRLR